MTIALPTRMFTGTLVAAVFVSVGFGAGFVSLDLPHPGRWGLAEIAWPTFCLLAGYFLRHVWLKGSHRDPVGRIRALSPRLQAVIYTVCLAGGLFAGVFASAAFGRFL